MSDTARYILGILTGVLATAAIYCLIITIGCAINGLTFGQQICQWMGDCAPLLEESVEQVVETVAQTPLV